jgi:hypothetical protein
VRHAQRHPSFRRVFKSLDKIAIFGRGLNDFFSTEEKVQIKSVVVYHMA